MPPVIKVSQLNRYVKSQLESDPRLKEVYVAGEIGTMTVNQRSGHLYFTLRDDEYSVRAVMFAKNAEFLKFMPRTGMAVVARGSATLYDRDGSFQIIASELMPDGAALSGFAFEKQKQLLAAKGYFNEERKRLIPNNPQTVGVVTSDSGAALHDIISVFERRNPTVKVIFAPAAVQGAQAPKSVAAAIAALNRDARCEVIIVGRGGGSAEDLWSFNDEAIVKAVFESKIPIISAVGHETDVTLCDLAADLRAATPTAAAQLAVFDSQQLFAELKMRKKHLDNCIKNSIKERERVLEEKKCAPQLKNPQFFINKNRQRLNNLILLMHNLSFKATDEKQRSLLERAALLDSLSPLKVLSRGYSIAQKQGRAVLSAEELEKGDIISLRLCDGTACAQIISSDREKNNDL